MGVAVLGPLQVDGQVDGLGPRDRAVLSALSVRAREPVSTEALAQVLWGERPPASWTKVVQGCVVRLRKLLGTAAIESGSTGYRLTLTDDELDHRLFERRLERAREALAGGDPGRCAYLVREALDLWRGPALGDLEEWEPGRVEAARLEGLRMEAEELLVEAEVGAGRAPTVLEQARSLVAQAPFRERRWVLLATALHQTGRQADALGAVKRARAMLVDELGLDPGHELVQLERLLLRQDPSLAAPVHRAVSAECPYRGLLAYDAEDADAFFGRDRDVAACLRRLRDSGVLTVVGPSGVGKSSLVRAGVVASLVRGRTPVLVITPGSHPMESLRGLRPHARQTVVVDQAEEAVTVCTDAAEREQYFAALAAHANAGGALVLTLRADHLGDLAPYGDIARVVEEGMYLLGPMDDVDLRSAIEGPAHRAGLRLEPGLVDLLVREVEGEPAALPLLSHVLRATWERREGPTLTVAGYRSTGGIRSAVARSAEALYDGLDPLARTRLRGLLLRLVVPSEGGDPVRARAPRSKLADDAVQARLVEMLVDARLVSIDGDSVQIAHEALVRVWPRLRAWLDDDIEGQRLFRHLAAAAEAWEAMGRPDSELYRGARLSRTLEWRERTEPHLDDTESAFLAAAATLSAHELRTAEQRVVHERGVNRRLRASLAGVAVLLVVAMLAGLVAVRSAERARRDQQRAERAAQLADARRVGVQALTHELAATSLLLGVAALDFDPSAGARENLVSTLSRLASLRRIQQLVDTPVSVAANVDGSVVAVSSPVEGLHLYDAVTLAPVPFADRTAASVVAFSPDGSLMAVAVNQWTPTGRPFISAQPVQLYDTATWRPVAAQLGGWPDGANVEYALAWSRNGRRIAAGVNRYSFASGSWEHIGAVMVWDLAHPSGPVLSVPLPELAQVALSPDGRHAYVATTGPRPLRIYDVDTGRLLRRAGSPGPEHAGLTGAAAVSADGSMLAVAHGNHIDRYDTRTLAPVEPSLRGHTGEVTDLDFAHEGSRLVSASADRTSIVWDAARGTVLRRFAAQNDQSWGAAFGRDDTTVYTTSADGTLMSWDLSGRQDLLVPGRGVSPAGGVEGLSMPAPDGHTVARLENGELWFADSRTGRAVRTTTQRDLQRWAWAKDARWFATTGFQRISVWDPRTGRLVAEHDHDGGDAIVAFAPDGRTLYAVDSHGAVEALDPTTMTATGRADVAAATVVGLAPHPDGTVFALKADGSVVRVDPARGRDVARSSSHLLAVVDNDVNDIAALSPDGSRLAVAPPGGSVQLLDADTFTWVGKKANTPWGFNALFAPDGSQFASVQTDRVRLWDGHTGEYLASVPLADVPAAGSRGTATLGPGVTIAYLPDSSGLLVTASDGRTWTVATRPAVWVRRACAIAGRNLTAAEWRQFFPGRPYRRSCPQWPTA